MHCRFVALSLLVISTFIYANAIYHHRKRNCYDVDKTLEMREADADVVLTGTVVRLKRSPNESVRKSGLVRIKRVLKGKNLLSAATKSLWIDGFDDPSLCDSHVRRRDTRIFLLSQETPQEHRLNSSLVRITLNNLDRVIAAIKDVPYKRRKPIKLKPCEALRCYYGGVCRVNKTTGKAFCKCSEKCDSKQIDRVCGSDNVTYMSRCHLRAAMCVGQRWIYEQSPSTCEVNNPCLRNNCKFGQKCVPSIDGLSHMCICPEKCDDYGDSRGSRPVCGDDGKDYETRCHLERAACTNPDKPIKVKFVGRCDPCADWPCPESTVCKVIAGRAPDCRCAEQCELDDAPVCASNGKTYLNECVMRVAACKQRKELKVFFNGRCETGDNPCAKKRLECDHGQECNVLNANSAECVCQYQCEPIMRPVCGHDDATYDNECQLRRIACLKRTHNSVKHTGFCGRGACANHDCYKHSICILEENQPKCVCPDCSDELKEVCGTNGITYPNHCWLRREACRLKKDIFKKYEGPCDGCQDQKCDFYQQCVVDGHGIGECQCPIAEDCGLERKPVCGTDGKTYANECLLKVAACQKQQFIVVATQTACDSCANIECPWGAKCQNGLCSCPESCPAHSSDDLVCASNLQLYQSQCLMQYDACKRGIVLQVVPLNHCPSDSSPTEVPMQGRCKCNKIGSYSDSCDHKKQCPCRPGVGGLKCNHCLPSFWGLHLIPKGNMGCQPCGCSVFGSERDDCEQTSGRCMCLEGVHGMKCDACARDHILRPNGCVHISSDFAAPQDCSQMRCHHAADCRMDAGTPSCKCPDNCSAYVPNEFDNSTREMAICGSDGMTYSSICQLKMFACRYQQDIVPISLGGCPHGDLKSRSAKPYSNQVLPPHEGGVSSPVPNEIVSSPAAPTQSVGNLGDVCDSDEGCKIEFSTCAEHIGKRVCVCQRNYIVEGDACVEFDSDAADNSLNSPCFERPCRNGGTCRVDPAADNGFSCVCPTDFAGHSCEIALPKHVYTLPQFGGHSWLEFDKMDAYSRVMIEIEIKPESDTGVLLYNGNKKGEQGDFISLALVDGFMEFRYNLGDGPAVLKSEKAIELRQWHKISASRRGLKAKLHVSQQETVKSHSQRSSERKNRHLNLNSNMFMGKVPHTPNFIIKQCGTDQGFAGCVRSLRINGKVYDLRQRISIDIRKTHMMGTCGVDPCSSLPCQHEGACSKINDTTFTCVCLAGYTGTFCQTALDACASFPCMYGGTCQSVEQGYHCICPHGRTGSTCDQTISEDENLWPVPEFHGESYLELRQLPKEAESTVSAEIWLKPFEPDGLVLYAGDANDFLGYNGGDFISVVLTEGVLQFSYNLGSGIVNISSERAITMNEWHSVKIHRHLRLGSIQVDNGTKHTGESPPPWEKLNLQTYPVYVGGVRDRNILPALVGAEQGLRGAIQKIIINGLTIDRPLQAAALSSAVSLYEGAPCDQHECRNDALCVPNLNQYRCQCKTDFTGTYCESKMRPQMHEERPVRFDGHTRLEFKNRITRSVLGQRKNHIQLQFKTQSTQGLILWENIGMTLSGDYLTVALKDGHVQLAFNLGKENTFRPVASTVFSADGEWHRLSVTRDKRQAYLKVDNEEPVSLLGKAGATELNTNGKLWIGSCPKLPMGLPSSYYLGFVGCLDQVQIDGHALHLSRHNLSPVNIQYCYS